MPQNYTGHARIFTEGEGTNDDDEAIITADVSEWNVFQLTSETGAMEVYVSLDGTNYAEFPIALDDLCATTLDRVIETVAGRLYGFRGPRSKVKVWQKGATAVTNATLACGKM